jgi:hypothetical protein
MNTIDVYDPAQCCATGACSPDADDELAQFAAALEWLKECGVSVSRYNLGHQPGAFVQNATVKGTIEKDGIGSLPLVIADGNIVSKGRYPSRAELARHAGLSSERTIEISAAPKRCCG